MDTQNSHSGLGVSRGRPPAAPAMRQLSTLITACMLVASWLALVAHA